MRQCCHESRNISLPDPPKKFVGWCYDLPPLKLLMYLVPFRAIAVELFVFFPIGADRSVDNFTKALV